jgi:hypothetical protein
VRADHGRARGGLPGRGVRLADRGARGGRGQAALLDEEERAGVAAHREREEAHVIRGGLGGDLDLERVVGVVHRRAGAVEQPGVVVADDRVDVGELLGRALVDHEDARQARLRVERQRRRRHADLDAHADRPAQDARGERTRRVTGDLLPLDPVEHGGLP